MLLRQIQIAAMRESVCLSRDGVRPALVRVPERIDGYARPKVEIFFPVGVRNGAALSGDDFKLPVPEHGYRVFFIFFCGGHDCLQIVIRRQ